MSTEVLQEERSRRPVTKAQRAKLLQVVKRMTPEQRARLLKTTLPRVVDPYCVHIPHPKQQVFMGLKTREAMYGGAAGGGKALALDTPLPTPRGWTTMGEVQVGDSLYDEAGQVVTVIGATEVMYDRDVYRVEFSDGSTILADTNHRWSVETATARSNRTAGRTSSRPSRRGNHHSADRSWQGRVLTTAEIAQNVRTGVNGRLTYSIPVSEPLKALRKHLVVDPYVLGVWLGDGDTRRGYVTIGEQDAHDMALALKGAGADIEAMNLTHYRVVGLSDGLRRAGILGTYRNPNPKRIPQSYLRASVQQRLALLQGIVDSDGHVDGDTEITWTSKGLVDDLMELLSSLGIKATVRESRATLNGKDCGPRYRVKFVTDMPVARLPRKAAAQKRDGFRGTHCRRYITSVTKVPSVPVRCIEVDGPTHLYLAGRTMIPTHNSDALLMSALQYVDVPGYSALLLRRTWPDLASPGAILDRANTWLRNTPAVRREGGRTWEFPTVDDEGKEAQPARLTFGTILREQDKFKYQSAEYQFIGFDELTHFQESQYTYMFSRIRRPRLVCLTCGGEVKKYDSGWKHSTKTKATLACTSLFPDPAVLRQYPQVRGGGMSIFEVPLRMRSATNPGGVGHDWVKSRFIDMRTRVDDAIFVPASLYDNPSIDQEEYVKSLTYLSPTDRDRLLSGDWDVVEQGSQFKRHWFKMLDTEPATSKVVRFWDNAATAGGGDWTVGAKVRLSDAGNWAIVDIVRGQWSTAEKVAIIRQTAAQDGPNVPIRMEQEPGSAGVDVIDAYRRTHLVGYNFNGMRATGSKEDRAYTWSAAAEAGNVYLVTAHWNRGFLDEVSQFPNGANDDQVDAVSGAVGFLAHGFGARLIS